VATNIQIPLIDALDVVALGLEAQRIS
jgi:hypothetical protein